MESQGQSVFCQDVKWEKCYLTIPENTAKGSSIMAILPPKFTDRASRSFVQELLDSRTSGDQRLFE